MRRKRFIIVALIMLMFLGLSIFGNKVIEAAEINLDEDTEQQIIEEYAKLINSDKENFYIPKYYGKFSGKEVFILSAKKSGNGIHQDVEEWLLFRGYLFKFGIPGEYLNIYCWEPGKFLNIKEAAEQKALSRQDICQIGILMGSLPKPEEMPYDDVDIENDWFGDSVYDAYAMSLMIGLDEESFGPYSLLSRAQFATIITRIESAYPEKLTAPYQDTFFDVQKEDWFRKAVLWSAEKGIVTGYENGCFDPADPITREQLAVMLYRYAKFKGDDVSGSVALDNYSDVTAVSDFAKEAISWCVAEGIISGNDGKLLPQGNATRAECAVMITRYMNNYS